MLWVLITALGMWALLTVSFFFAHASEFNEAKDMEQAHRVQEERRLEARTSPDSDFLKYIRAQKEHHRKWKEAARRLALRSPLNPFEWIAHAVKWIAGPFKP